MSYIHESHRYLAQQPPVNEFSPGSIDRIIYRIMNYSRTRPVKPTVLPEVLAKAEPYTWAPWYDMTKSVEASGDLCIIKLKKELVSRSNLIISQALCTLSDLFHNPEFACNALLHNIQARLVKLLKHPYPFIKQKTLLCITILANQPFGKIRLPDNKALIRNIIDCLEDDSYIIKNQTIMAINAFLLTPLAKPKLIAENYVEKIINCLIKYKEDEIQQYYDENYLEMLINNLCNLVEGSCEAMVQAMAYGVFELFDLLIHKCYKIRNAIAEVYGALFLHEIGLLSTTHWPFIEYLIAAIDKEEPTHNFGILGTLRLAVLKTECRKQAVSLGLIDVLVELLHKTHNTTIYSIIFQVLNVLAEYPLARQVINNKSLASLSLYSYFGSDGSMK